MDVSSARKQLIKLREILATRFSKGDLQTLCFDCGVEYDDLPGEGRSDRARELVRYFERRNRIPELIEAVKRLRSDIVWDNANQTESSEILKGLELNRRDVENDLHRLKRELLVAQDTSDELTASRLRDSIKRYEERHEAILTDIDYEEARIFDQGRIHALKGKRKATASLEIVRRLMREVSEDRIKFGDSDPMIRKKYRDIQSYLRIAAEHESSVIRAIQYLERARLSYEHYNNPRRALDECKESIALNPGNEEAYLYRISIREQLRGDASFDQKQLEQSIRKDKQKLRELRQNAVGNQANNREQRHASAADRTTPRRRPGRRTR